MHITEKKCLKCPAVFKSWAGKNSKGEVIDANIPQLCLKCAFSIVRKPTKVGNVTFVDFSQARLATAR